MEERKGRRWKVRLESREETKGAYSALGLSAMLLLEPDEGLEQFIELRPGNRPVGVWMDERQRWARRA